jgi:antitoxin (DNA-binding transcriptional repressor) of toxin-antitoxin stability system
MKFISIRELRSSTAQIKEMLADGGKIVLTVNGKPSALMIEIDEDSFEDVLDDLRATRSRRAIRQLQEHSLKTGLNNMTLDDINAEIFAARRESI